MRLDGLYVVCGRLHLHILVFSHPQSRRRPRGWVSVVISSVFVIRCAICAMCNKRGRGYVAQLYQLLTLALPKGWDTH